MIQNQRFPFEDDAKKNAPIPKGLTGAEQVLYQGLALLYQRYQQGYLSNADAKREKAELIKQYEKLAFDERLWCSSRRMWTALAGASAEFRKHPTIEGGKKCLDIVYGILPTS